MAIKERTAATWRYDFAMKMEAKCASECLQPSAKLHSCTLQKLVQSSSQNSYTCLRIFFSAG